MQGLIEVFRKELADMFTGVRFLIMFLVILVAGVLLAYGASLGIKPVLTNNGASITGTIPFVFLQLFTAPPSKDFPFTFLTAISILVPIVGIALGFDSINREKNTGTMSRLLAQPIYRDAVINGKFLAGVVTIATMLTAIVLIVCGIGIRQIGVVPNSEEAMRILAFLIASIVYGAFWLGLAMFFSVLFDRPATSVMAAIAVWIFFVVFLGIIAKGLAGLMAPVPQGSADVPLIIRNLDLESTFNRFSPIGLYNEASFYLLEPNLRSLSAIPPAIQNWMVDNPIAFGQSLLIVWSHLVILIALTVVCFAGSYIKFMREEIRST